MCPENVPFQFYIIVRKESLAVKGAISLTLDRLSLLPLPSSVLEQRKEMGYCSLLNLNLPLLLLDSPFCLWLLWD